MSSLSHASLASSRGALPARRRADAKRAVPYAERRLSRAACSCGGTCPHCSNDAGTAFTRPKLAVNTPGDTFEHEADRVSDRVMRMPASPGPFHKSNVTTADKSPVRKAAKSPGFPLGEQLSDFFEPRFGYDLSGVRLHVGASAGASARSIGARAYTVGSDIVFASGEYDPSSHRGRSLIAHELTHVVQQSTSSNAPAVQRQPAELDLGRWT